VRFTRDLRERIVEHLAGHVVQRVQAPEARHAAVAVVLLPDEDGRACFVLTRRLATLRRHSGQWALPGGRVDADETSLAAALREVHEEIGLRIDAESALGTLDDFATRSGHLITPWVLWVEDAAPLRISVDEVDAAFLVPLDELDAPDAVSFEPLLHFALVGSTVYAPTAAIVYQFREVGLHGRSVRVADTEQPFFAWR
jgi:8-oxo-dGTP pyrophosphatase MutT (NUDIX family)